VALISANALSVAKDIFMGLVVLQRFPANIRRYNKRIKGLEEA
jgi:hypothetical protein